MLNDPAFEIGLEELKDLAKKQRTCIMCSEVLWWRCHRSMISDRLKADGWKVHHIMGLNKEEEHPFTAPAPSSMGDWLMAPMKASSLSQGRTDGLRSVIVPASTPRAA